MHIPNNDDIWGFLNLNRKILLKVTGRAMKKNRSGLNRTSSNRPRIDHPPCVIHVRTRTRSTVVTRNGGQQRDDSFFEHRPPRREKSGPSLPALFKSLLSTMEPLESTCSALTCWNAQHAGVPSESPQRTAPDSKMYSTEDDEWARESSTIVLKYSITPNPREIPSMVETIADDESSVFNLSLSIGEEEFDIDH